MANPFAGMITAAFKAKHKNMIDALLEDTALTVPCRLEYSTTKFDLCSNCIYSPVGNKSSNRFKTGGPVPFHHGVCPVCSGAGRIQTTDSEILFLMPIWDSKGWLQMGLTAERTAGIDVVTFSKATTYPDLKRATTIQIDTTIEAYGVPTFERADEPQWCGLAQSSHILTLWKRV